MVTWFSGQLKIKCFIHLPLQAMTNVSWQMKARKHICFNPGQWFRSITQASHISLVPESLGWAWGNDVPPTASKEQVWDHLMKLNRYKAPRAWWDASQSPKGDRLYCCQAPLHHIWKVMAVRWSSWWLQKGKLLLLLKREETKLLVNLTVCLGISQIRSPWSNIRAHTRQRGDPGQPAHLYWGQIMPDHSYGLPWWQQSTRKSKCCNLPGLL